MPELDILVERHGFVPELVEAIIDEKFLPKDDACKLWADAMDVAYVDPLASVITDEAIERIPAEIAKKTRSICLYVLDGVLTVAMATPPEMKSASTTLMRSPSRITRVFTSIGAMPGRRNMSTVRRAGMKSSLP